MPLNMQLNYGYSSDRRWSLCTRTRTVSRCFWCSSIMGIPVTDGGHRLSVHVLYHAVFDAAQLWVFQWLTAVTDCQYMYCITLFLMRLNYGYSSVTGCLYTYCITLSLMQLNYGYSSDWRRSPTVSTYTVSCCFWCGSIMGIPVIDGGHRLSVHVLYHAVLMWCKNQSTKCVKSKTKIKDLRLSLEDTRFQKQTGYQIWLND